MYQDYDLSQDCDFEYIQEQKLLLFDEFESEMRKRVENIEVFEKFYFLEPKNFPKKEAD